MKKLLLTAAICLTAITLSRADECSDYIALPLIDTPFVPAPQGPDRLIGIGLLRQLRGTN